MYSRYRMFSHVLIVLLLSAIPVMAQNARIQLIHNSGDLDAGAGPDAMEIRVDGDSLTSLNFREATAFQDLAAGTHGFEFVVRDPSTNLPVTVGPDSVTLNAGITYVGIIDGISPLNLARGAYTQPAGRDVELTIFAISDARETANDASMVEFIIHNGSTDAPAVDVIANSAITVADSLDYAATTAYIAVPPAVFQLDVTPGDDNATILGTFEADLTGLAGSTAVLLTSGFLVSADNQGGAELALLGVFADGTTLVLEDLTVGPVGEWAFAGPSEYVFDDFFGADTLVNGGHAVQVDKFNRIWVGNFFSALRVISPEGVEADFSPINDVTIGANTIVMDNCRGLELDNDGNILFSQSGGPGGNVIRINVETGEGMNIFAPGGSQLKVGVDGNGFIYTGLVVGINPITVLEPTFFAATQQITLDNPPSFGRGLAVTEDGLTIFTPDLAGSGAPLRIWRSSDGGLTYPMVDSVWTNTDGEQIFNTNLQTFDWGPDSTLWVSVDNALNASDDNQLVILDFATKAYKTLAFPVVNNDPTLVNGPRGVSFSATGDTAYSIIWTTGNRIARFIEGGAVSVKDRTVLNIPGSYELRQNYPNPFNPSTNIAFKVGEKGPVTLKVYNLLGKEVATILDKKVVTAGLHEVTFDASGLASGVYYYKLSANGNVLTKKMTFMK